MATLSDISSKLRNLNLDKILDASIDETKDSIVSENKSQLLIGKAVDGTILGTYTKEYAKRKSKKQGSLAPYGVYDFFLTGSFQKDMYASVKPEVVEVGSIDLKEQWLEKYANGANRVFGLQGENLKRYAQDKLKPVLQTKLRTALNL